MLLYYYGHYGYTAAVMRLMQPMRVLPLRYGHCDSAKPRLTLLWLRVGVLAVADRMRIAGDVHVHVFTSAMVNMAALRSRGPRAGKCH